LIDCLHAGKPVLASNIGEVRNMLATGDGLAGEVFDLENWTIPIEVVGGIILQLANDPDTYRELVRRVPLAAAKFDSKKMADEYEAVYQQCMLKANRSVVPMTRQPVT